MKINRIVKSFPLLIFILGCGYILVYGFLSMNSQQNSMYEFIVGRWVNESTQVINGKTTLEWRQLEFLDSNKLVLNEISSQSGLYNVVFLYEWKSDKQISLIGRGGGVLEISKDDDELLIQTEGLVLQSGKYKRNPTIQWGVLAIVLGVVVFELLFLNLDQVLPKNLQAKNILEHKPWKSRKKLTILLFSLLALILLVIGGVITSSIWYVSALNSILIPCDAIITLEFALMLLIVGAKSVILSFRSDLISSFLSFCCFILGTLLVGSSVLGIIIGLIKLGIFIRFGYYPTG